ncbi:MAG: phosphate propanoyltransferase [Firmicutes bacterium]|nr:phosphate propanoyltransferase [Bacillota bacterium]
MKVSIGVSNRHVHLKKEDLEILFGEGYELTVLRPINQIGQFASSDTVTIKTSKSEIPNVRILGPVRPYTQVEISKTDAFKLGINPPIRKSGDILGSAAVTIIGPKGVLNINEGCIIADRHIHMTPEQQKELGFVGIEEIKLEVDSIKGGIFDHVKLRVADNSYYEVHIDTDDANAFLINDGDEVEIIK